MKAMIAERIEPHVVHGPSDADGAESRLRVLLVIDSLGSGGAERSLVEMLPGLQRGGVDPSVVCLIRRPEGFESEVVGRFDVTFLQPGGRLARARAIRRIIKARRPDVLHTTLLESHFSGSLAAIGTNTVVLSSLVNTPYEPIRFRDPRIRPWRLRLVQAADSFAARFLTTHFHAVAQAVKAHAVDHLRVPPERITVIERGRNRVRLGVPGPERRARARQALGLRPDDEVLVHVGRQEYQKGHQFLVEAFERLARRRERLVLLVAGREGGTTDELAQQRLRLSADDRVRFLGHRDDVPEILAAADVFVFPSLFEGLGGSLIEAMALGLPIVASSLPAIGEVLEEGGNAALVPPGDAAALEQAINGLLDDPARRERYGKRSLEIFEDRFTLDRCTDRMVRLYRTVVAEAASGDRGRRRAKGEAG